MSLNKQERIKQILNHLDFLVRDSSLSQEDFCYLTEIQDILSDMQDSWEEENLS